MEAHLGFHSPAFRCVLGRHCSLQVGLAGHEYRTDRCPGSPSQTNVGRSVGECRLLDPACHHDCQTNHDPHQYDFPAHDPHLRVTYVQTPMRRGLTGVSCASLASFHTQNLTFL